MNKILILIFFTTISSTLMSQSAPIEVVWESVLENLKDKYPSIAQTNEGGHVLATSVHYDNTRIHSRVIKYDSAGEIKWQKDFKSLSNNIVYSIDATKDNGFILTGFKTSLKNKNNKDLWVLKLNSEEIKNGVKLMEEKKSNEVGRSIIEIRKGGYIIAGHRDTKKKEFSWVIKIDESGKLDWENSFSKKTYNGLNSIIETNNGDFCFAGHIQREDSQNLNFFIAKINANGNKVWSRSIGSMKTDFGADIVETKDGSLMIVGFTSLDLENESAYIKKSALVIKLSSNGILEWKKNYTGIYDTIATSIAKDDKDNCILAGQTCKNMRTNCSAWILKINSSGEELWNKTIKDDRFQNAYSVITTDDNGFIVVGIKGKNSLEECNLWVAKLK